MNRNISRVIAVGRPGLLLLAVVLSLSTFGGAQSLRSAGRQASNAKSVISPNSDPRPIVSEPAAPAAPSATLVLYDQFDAPTGTGVTSQNFETVNDPFDNQAADDFVVPAGQTWRINQVEAGGTYSAVGPAASFSVTFYSDAATLPGAVVAGCTYPAASYAAAAGTFTITLATPCVLSAGTYWVSIQSNQDNATAGQWFWNNRTTQSNSGAAWRNPGNGFATGCTAYGRRTTCLPTSTGLDQIFRLSTFLTAARVEVGGRVLGDGGRGLTNARVTLSDQGGESRSVVTGRNGRFVFDDVEAGKTYVISIGSRRYAYSPRLLEVTENVSDLLFSPEDGLMRGR